MASNEPTLREIINEYTTMSRLAKSLDISRPSVYKYVAKFDSGDMESIPEEILRFFNTVKMSPKSGRREIFTMKYNSYLDTEEARMMENPVPKEIADIIDRLGMTTDQIDERIDRALEVRQHQIELGYGDDHLSVQRVEHDLKNLQYTRDMIERRSKEIKFWPITEGDMDWYVDENNHGWPCPYDEMELEINPELKNFFKFCLLRNATGLTFLFDNLGFDNNTVEVTISARIPKTSIPIGVFINEPGQNYIIIPKIFDAAYSYHFEYSIIRRAENGEVLNSIKPIPLY